MNIYLCLLIEKEKKKRIHSYIHSVYVDLTETKILRQ
jgi:hypothetical protein